MVVLTGIIMGPAILLLLLSRLVAEVDSFAAAGVHRPHPDRRFALNLFPSRAPKIPSSSTERDSVAISSVKEALNRPRDPSFPLVEIEFPPLGALNKLGDGSLRSSIQVEEANVDFANKLVKGIFTPFGGLGLGPSVSLVLSSSASKSLAKKAESKVKAAKIYSVRGGLPDEVKGSKDMVCVFLTPSSQQDYKEARQLAETGTKVLLLNGSFKDARSVPGNATTGYYLKPLTYNSSVAGYLIRSYPSRWTVLDAVSKRELGSFSDEEILVPMTNTPDLRASAGLVAKSFDERAIQQRSR